MFKDKQDELKNLLQRTEEHFLSWLDKLSALEIPDDIVSGKTEIRSAAP
jgi:hypothetical protein